MVGDAAMRRKPPTGGDPSAPHRRHAGAPDATDTGLSRTPLPVELAALENLLPPATLDWAAARARDLGIGGDEVLIAAGLMAPEAVARACAGHLSVGLETESHPVRIAPIDARAALRLEMMAEEADGRAVYTFAARGKVLRRLARAVARDPDLRARVKLSTPAGLRARLTRMAARRLAQEAAFDLRDTAPHFSAGTLDTARICAYGLALAICVALLANWLMPAFALLIAQTAFALVFLSSVGIRLAACLVPPSPAALSPAPAVRVSGADKALPIYTVIVPLYREAAVIPRLEAALCALDYPPEKLDIKLVVERDDRETRTALARRALPAWFEVVVAPPVGPRTKPKALNAALPFARGGFVVIFDAEDVPEPGQLRAALAAFRRGGEKVACVQARLAADNAGDSWISRQFAAEYAGHFDVLVPALAVFGLPILLGGTSNHFRRHALEQVGGWDPFNVTEDADLGLRLARAGWRTEVIASTTQEEAPVSVRAWMRQRTRWMKGWGQTLLVHLRQPRRFRRDLGTFGACGAVVLTAAPFVATLLYPLCLLVMAHDIWAGAFGRSAGSLAHVLASAVSYTTLIVGYGGQVLFSAEGLRRRPVPHGGFVLLTLPLYWGLQSLAAWRALPDLALDPYRWDKTEHGLAASGRRNAPPARAGQRLAVGPRDRAPAGSQTG